MTIYVDENISPYLAEGLNILQQKEFPGIEVKAIEKVFRKGIPDEEWIPVAGSENACVITQDINIHRTRSQLQLYREHKLGFFFLKPPGKGSFRYWDMVQLIIKHWPAIAKAATKTQKPFAYRFTSRSGKLENIGD